MSTNIASGARARRGAGNEPKRKRARGKLPENRETSDVSTRQNADVGTNAPKSGEQRGVVTKVAKLSGAEISRHIFHPLMSAARVLVRSQKGTDLAENQWDMQVLVDELVNSTNKLAKGDMSHVEQMLMHQATALQAIFTRLTERAFASSEIPSYDLFMRFGLRAQSQCRATLETLAAVKNPPVVYARQANVTTGPQQVNNGVGPAARAG